MVQAMVARDLTQASGIVNYHGARLDAEEATLPKDPEHSVDMNSAKAKGVRQDILIERTFKLGFRRETHQYETFSKLHKEVSYAPRGGSPPDIDKMFDGHRFVSRGAPEKTCPDAWKIVE